MTSPESDYYFKTNAPLRAYTQPRDEWTTQQFRQPAYTRTQHQQQLPEPWPDYYPPKPKRKKRVFLWAFLAVQAFFIVWIIAGLATVHTGPSQADLAQVCYHHAWWPLFKSQADCVTHYGHALQSAGNVGKGLGVAVVILFWFVVDVILGVSYGVYRLATRR